MTNAIECHYPANKPKCTRPRIQHSDDASTEPRKKAPSLVTDPPNVENHQGANKDGHITDDSALVIADSEFANPGEEYLDWGDAGIDFADFLDPSTNDEAFEYPSLSSSSLVNHSTPSTNQAVQVQQAISSLNISIPIVPTYNIRLLIPRPKMRTGTQKIANLILYTLKSYPLMIMRHNSLPPFIHSRWISSNSENNFMEPLTNCISLVRMINSGVQGSRKLFWKNVRMECERLCGEVR
jgi:hypothetical protein